MLKYKLKFFLILLIISWLFIANSCIIVKEKDEIIVKKSEPITAKAPKPEVKMSNKTIRTPEGDMLALLPENWFFVEANESLSSEIFAVAVNPEYTLSAIFSKIKKNEENENIVKKEGLLGLARFCFSKQSQKAANNLNLVEKYEVNDLEYQKFCTFAYVREKDNAFGKSAVFISSINNYYEFSLVTLNISNNLNYDKNEFDKIYRSFLATLKY